MLLHQNWEGVAEPRFLIKVTVLLTVFVNSKILTFFIDLKTKPFLLNLKTVLENSKTIYFQKPNGF